VPLHTAALGWSSLPMLRPDQVTDSLHAYQRSSCGTCTATTCWDSSTITPVLSRASRSVPMDAASRPLTSEGTVVLLDVQSRQPLGVSLHTHQLVNSVAYSPDGRTFAAGGFNGKMRVWPGVP